MPVQPSLGEMSVCRCQQMKGPGSILPGPGLSLGPGFGRHGVVTWTRSWNPMVSSGPGARLCADRDPRDPVASDPSSSMPGKLLKLIPRELIVSQETPLQKLN